MAQKHIINCHIHTFNRENVSPKYPPYLRVFRRYRLARCFARKLLWLCGRIIKGRDICEGYSNFIEIVAYGAQKEIFKEVRGRYPLNTQPKTSGQQ